MQRVMIMHLWYLNHFLMRCLFMMEMIRVRVRVVEPWKHPVLMIVNRLDIVLIVESMVKFGENLVIDPRISGALLVMMLARLVMAVGDNRVKNLVMVDGRLLVLVVLLDDIGDLYCGLIVDELNLRFMNDWPPDLFSVDNFRCLMMYWLLIDNFNLLMVRLIGVMEVIRMGIRVVEARKHGMIIEWDRLNIRLAVIVMIKRAICPVTPIISSSPLVYITTVLVHNHVPVALILSSHVHWRLPVTRRLVKQLALALGVVRF